MRRARAVGVLLLLAAGGLWAAEALVYFRTSVRHRDVRALAARLQEELGPRGTLAVDPGDNSVVVRDERGRVDAVRALLQALDVPARRFALQAEFGVFAPAAGPGLLRDRWDYADATAWLERARPVREIRTLLDVSEGASSEVPLLPGYTLRATVEGFDPVRRRLGFASLSVTRAEGDRAVPLLGGRATLPEGEPTVFFLAPAGEAPCRLALTPTLLPSAERREVP